MCRATNLVVCVAIGLHACSSDNNDKKEQAPDLVAAIDGDPAEPVINAIGWVTPSPDDPALADSLFTEDSYGRRVLRTAMHIVFAADATVGQVNDLLASMQARVVGSMPNLASAAVEFPDPGSLGALDALVAAVEAESFVWFAEKSILPATPALPSNFVLDAGSLDRIRHHLAVGGHAAWNARSAATSVPQVAVMDYFGDGSPNETFDTSDDGMNTFATGRLNVHGYHVLGIIAAKHGAPTTAGTDIEARLATGMTPRTTRLVALDIEHYRNVSSLRYLLFRDLRRLTGTAVLNMSLGNACTGDGGRCRDLDSALKSAAHWTKAVRVTGLENRLLIVNSAGNTDDALPGVNDALTNYHATAAALTSDMADDSGIGVPPLTNTLVVENVRATSVAPYAPECLSDRSFVGGTIGAIGTDVTSLKDHGTAGGKLSGTSMAAPQVTGLAAYILSIAPTLTPQQLVSLLINTATPVPTGAIAPCNAHSTPAPVIDAYAAVLRLDTAIAPTTAPVRKALFDVTADGQFDELDLDRFSNVFGFSALDPDPAAKDYGDFDLNGDGFTGGHTVRRHFDLDVTGVIPFGSPTYTVVTQSVGGVRMVFDESTLSDLDVLCYYAYSDLYTGTSGARADRLSLLQCADVLLDAQLPTTFGDQGAELYVRLGLFDHLGVTYGAQGARVNITVTGGTVTDATGTLDANGEFRSMVYLGAGSNGVEVDIELVSPDDGYVIADRLRTASRNVVGDIVFATDRDGDLEIYTVMEDGTGLVNLSSNGAWDGDPRFSPDKTKIAFTSSRGNNYDIYVMDSNGGNVTRITTDPGFDNQPTWSPDGYEIAFTTNRNGNLDIYVATSDGSSVQQVTTSTFDDQQPDWSPDGFAIAFTSTRNPDVSYINQIYTISPSGGVATLISQSIRTETNAAWSPDGTMFAFAGYPGSTSTNSQVYLMTANGAGKVAITTNTLSETSPAWSGDGARIMFSRYIDTTDGYDMFIMDSDGANEVPIFVGPGNDFGGHWR